MTTEDNIPSLQELGISNARQWRLVIKIEAEKFWYAMQSDATDGFTGGHIDFPAPGKKILCKAIEDAIYNTPLPGNDFNHVDVIIDNNSFLLAPADYVTDDNSEALLRAAFGDDNDAKDNLVFTEKTASPDTTLVWTVDKNICNFFMRTFYNASFSHAIMPVINHSIKRGVLANTPRIFVIADGNSMKVVATEGNRLKMANRFSAKNADDFVYYLLATWKECKFDSTSAEMLFSGNAPWRKEAEDSLRDYIKLVLPDLYPPQLIKISKDTATYPIDMMLKLI